MTNNLIINNKQKRNNHHSSHSLGDKWTTGWASPVSPWASPMVKRSWDVKPLGHWGEMKPELYSAGLVAKPWEVKPMVDQVSFDDPAKPFKYSASIIHDKAIAA